MAYRDDILAPFRLVRDLWLLWVRSPAKSRVDRSRMYLWVHLGLVITGWALMFHPSGVGAMAYFDKQQNETLALCVIVGSTVCILGSLMGTRHWFPSAKTDVRLPYLFAVGGQISVIFTLCLYEFTLAVHQSTYVNLSGALAFAIIGGCTQTALVCIKEIHRINRLDRIVNRGTIRRRKSRYDLSVDIGEAEER
ncbi:hypothetical protein A5646_12850 [Mycobacterium sp. 1245499.0]|uniref:CidA/LrgA family protein n=1 Tax=Mycobacterium sp. 1245499.0 TaxID=1834074 RepID=UPI0007FFE829|nr:CidA/LrgA family protein [Mycobacterium sp. 1245499.0]OBL08219.1 hypothetical protein A5646_12850 [Mycobacterium sp. 1245499.0]